CAEMAFRAKGIQGITQEHLVRKYKASATDQRAIELEIIQALAEHEPRERPDRGLPRQVSGDLGPLVKAAVRSASIYTSQDDAVEDMRQGEPVLLGLKNWEGMLGHVVILTKIEYQEKGRTRTGLGPLDGLMDRVEQVREDLGGDTRYRVRAVEFLDPRRGQTEPRTMTDGELRRHANFWLSTRKAGQIAADARRSLQMR
ncbi:MAG TPA: hypothetical protein VD963_08915, partial [Phycisphaerales bacterium]|nr:hypothetical protein [Phycisphaerales bacterium]